MSRFQRENQLDMEQILVAYCPTGTDQGFVKGDPLVNNTTALSIADGQLGVLSWDHNGTVPFGTFLSGGETPTDVRAIKVLQGTPASANLTKADPWEVGHKGYVDSGIIKRDNIRSVTVSKCRPKALSNAAVTDLPTPCDDTEYRFFTPINSVRSTLYNGYNGNNVHAAYETPCYSAMGIVDPKDHYLQNILFRYNKQSSLAALSNGSYSNGNKPVIAFAINTAGGAGTAIGAITCGTRIPFMMDQDMYCDQLTTPTVSEMVADVALVRSLACTVAKQAMGLASGSITTPITAASTIEVIDLANAGAAPNVDAFIIIGLEHELSRGVDTLPQTLTHVDINLQAGFNVEGVSKTCCRADEGTGSGRGWKIENDKRFQRVIHSMYANSDRGSLTLSEGESYIDPTKSYTSILIDYYDSEENGITLQEQTSKQLIILTCCAWECIDVATTAGNIATNAAAKNPSGKVDLMPTTEIACCPVCDPDAPATALQGDIATVLFTWLKACDVNFNNGIEFDDYYLNGAPSVLFTAAGI